jgi:hypothetical protein
MSTPDRRGMLDRADKALSIRRQCMLLGIARSGVYRPPRPANDNDLALMRRIDELFTAWPFLGSRRMTAMLKAEGLQVNRKRVQRLMRKMGIAALGPKPNTTRPAPGHKIYPYLLRNMTIDRPNHVWAADITYLPIGRGFLYLVAIIDWASRAVLAWRLSNTMDARPSPARWWPQRSRSPWMAAVVGWTTSSSSGCGGRSSMRTSISRAMPTAARPKQGSRAGSPSTTIVAFIRRSAIARRWRSGANGCTPRRPWTWWTTLTR